MIIAAWCKIVNTVANACHVNEAAKEADLAVYSTVTSVVTPEKGISSRELSMAHSGLCPQPRSANGKLGT